MFKLRKQTFVLIFHSFLFAAGLRGRGTELRNIISSLYFITKYQWILFHNFVELEQQNPGQANKK